MNKEKIKIILAFGAIYVLWGSTYLANKFALTAFPPFIMTGLRFSIAGFALLLFLILKGESLPKIKQWKEPLIIGGFMLCICNGFTAIAQQKIPSGLTALLLSVTPFYMTIIDWFFNRNNKPKLLEITGILVGFSGVGLLVYSNTGLDTGNLDFFSLLLLLLAPLAWTIGALFSRHRHQGSSSFIPVAQQMISGGILLLFFSFPKNEWTEFNISSVTVSSMLAILYLIIFGSLIGYSSYIWLLKKCKPTIVSTNTFVNPLIALILGATLAGETLSVMILFSSLMIISAVIIITISHLSSR